MKKIALIMIGILMFCKVQAQTLNNKLVYEYDANGNRESRTLVQVFGKMNPAEIIKKNPADSVNNNEIPSLLKVFPNPTANAVEVNFISVYEDQIKYIKLYDMKGAIINTLTKISLNNIIDMSNYQAGLYVLVVEVNNQIFKYQILKTNQ